MRGETHSPGYRELRLHLTLWGWLVVPTVHDTPMDVSVLCVFAMSQPSPQHGLQTMGSTVRRIPILDAMFAFQVCERKDAHLPK